MVYRMARGRYNRRRDMGKPGRKRQYGVMNRRFQYKRGGAPKQPVQFFKRTAYFNGIFQVGSAPLSQVAQFRLSDVPGASEFTTLYDQYQIKAVKYTLIPKFTNMTLNVNPAGGAINSAILGNVWSVIDYDDLTPALTLNQLLEYQNTKRTQMNKLHSRYFKPKVLTGIVNSAGVVLNNTAKKNQWLDCATSSTPHYGLKIWFDAVAGTTTTEVQYDLVVKYYLAFKNVR